MVRIQIYGTDRFLEAVEPEVTYVKTSGNLGEITKINSSYSWTMKFPKSPNNTATLDGLGLPGSGSRKPYEKIYCNLTDNGFPIAIKALLNIRETNDNYDIFIQEGFIDFIKDMQNDNVSDIGVSELDHARTYENIVDSFTLDKPYAYLVGDVNGAYLPNISGTTNLDARYMSPFANIGFIWDKLFQKYGWTYDMNPQALQSIRDTWVSYPSEIEITNAQVINAGELSAEEVRGEFQSTEFGARKYKIPLPDRTVNNNYLLPQVVGDINFVVQQDGNYDISMFARGSLKVLTLANGEQEGGFNVGLWIGDELIIYNRIIGENNDGTPVNFQRTLRTGDIISLGVLAGGTNYRLILDQVMDIQEAGLTINYLNPDGNIGDISFTRALLDLKVSDFVKEVMVRESLTSFTDSENKHIKFLTLDDRFEQEIINWTGKYSERKGETYLYNNYAQNNLLRHKYDDEVSDYRDGNLFVDNRNLETKETLYTSLGFAPEQELGIFTDNGQNYNVPSIKMFKIEVKKDEATGDLIGTYKFLKDRFFFVKHNRVTRNIYIGDNLIEGFPMISTNGATFDNIVAEKYTKFINFSVSSKVHEIELALSISDIIGLKLYGIYYFEQEAAYYFLNKLNYKTGTKSKGEFLKIIPNQKLQAFSNAFSNAFSI